MSFARYFPVPGMNHCLGGPALDNFDALDAITQWVEQGKAPDSILASGAQSPIVSAALCVAQTRQMQRNRAARRRREFHLQRVTAISGRCTAKIPPRWPVLWRTLDIRDRSTSAGSGRPQ
jgi:hypothetical protein